MNIQSTSIKRKLIILVTLMITLLIVFSLSIIFMVTRMANYSSSIINHPLQVSNSAFYANIEMMRMKKDLAHILLADEEYEINTYLDQISASEAKVHSSLNIVGNHILGEEGEALYDEAKILFVDWKPIRTEVVDAVRAGHIEQALEISKFKEEIHSQDLERKLVDLNQYARVKAKEFESDVTRLERNIIIGTVVGIIILTFVLITSVTWVGVNIINGIKDLSNQLEEVIGGSQFKEVAIVGNSELEQLNNVFSKLFKSLQKQIWIKEGNQTLYNILSEKDSSKMIIENYLHEMIVYANIISCGFYEIKGNQITLLSVENRISLFEEHYTMGDGLVGECAQRKVEKNIEVALSDNLVGVEIPYGYIKVIPVKKEADVLGVIMLVASKKPSDSVEEYIKNGMKELSVYLERQKQGDLLNQNSRALIAQNEELMELRETLEIKYKDLEESTKYRTQFIANVSHELRTPLNSIIILSDILVNKEVEESVEDAFEKINVINIAAKELLRIINSILDLARAESNKMEVENAIFSTHDIMRSGQMMFEPIINNKGLKAVFDMPKEYVLIGDEAKVYHIISNLLGNAIKFTNSGTISLSIKVVEGESFPVKIEVRDTGIGIAQDKMEAVFEEFVQSDGSINRNFGGTGLGLAICRSYAELIGGIIEVESELGVGSCFKLLLPDTYLAKSEVSQQPSDYNIYTLEQAVEETLNLEGKTALVCDDEAFNIFALSSILENFGVESLGALNYDEALSIYADHQVDIIFMDIMMPQKDGFEIIEGLKSTSKWGEPPIIMVTAANLDGKLLYNIEREGYGLLRKPVVISELRESMEEIFIRK